MAQQQQQEKFDLYLDENPKRIEGTTLLKLPAYVQTRPQKVTGKL